MTDQSSLSREVQVVRDAIQEWYDARDATPQRYEAARVAFLSACRALQTRLRAIPPRPSIQEVRDALYEAIHAEGTSAYETKRARHQYLCDVLTIHEALDVKATIHQ